VSLSISRSRELRNVSSISGRKPSTRSHSSQTDTLWLNNYVSVRSVSKVIRHFLSGCDSVLDELNSARENINDPVRP
jgi:hypothetical protein